MALIKCDECGKEISSNAQICPGCGAKTAKHRKNVKKVATIIIAILVLVGAFFIIKNQVENYAVQKESKTQEEAEESQYNSVRYFPLYNEDIYSSIKSARIKDDFAGGEYKLIADTSLDSLAASHVAEIATQDRDSGGSLFGNDTSINSTTIVESNVCGSVDFIYRDSNTAAIDCEHIASVFVFLAWFDLKLGKDTWNSGISVCEYKGYRYICFAFEK